METFAKLFERFLVFVYHCFDRIVIQGYLPLLTRSDHTVYFFRDVHGQYPITPQVLARRTLEYRGWVEGYARNHKIPMLKAEKGVSISVDTKKKELVGDFKNGGREWQPKGEPEGVRVHDFKIDQPDKGKVAPYGVYDLARNEGWVSVGVDHDTAAFAVESIRRWWRLMGSARYSKAKRLLITAGLRREQRVRVRLWKWELQQFADETGLEISVCHFPPGTSKWNKIEHRLFSFISENWRGKPLISHEVIINLIAATTSKTRLEVKSDLDPNSYPEGIKISDRQMAELRLKRDTFHGESNYRLLPRS